MEQKEIDAIIAESQQLIKNCEKTLKEDQAMKKEIDFVINEYKTNKRWFREEPGRVTIEDVIKTAVEFGWNSKRNYDLSPELYG